MDKLVLKPWSFCPEPMLVQVPDGCPLCQTACEALAVSYLLHIQRLPLVLFDSLLYQSVLSHLQVKESHAAHQEPSWLLHM